MHFYIETKSLNAGLATVNKALSAHPVMNILEGIYLQCTDNTILLRCSDLSLQIECMLHASVEEPGEIVLPGRLFSEMMRKMPEDTMEFRLEDNTAHLKCGRARFSMQCMNPDEYPLMSFQGPHLSIQVSQCALKNMIRKTVFATAQDESKPILTGVLLQTDETGLTLVALDGYRLARTKAPLSRAYEMNEAVVPAKSINEIARTLTDSDESIDLIFTNTHVMLDMKHTKITARLLDGEFVRYNQMLPKEHMTRVRINRAALFESIERAMLMAREGNNNLVRFRIDQETLVINSNSAIGKIDEEIPIHCDGGDMEIAFNAKYFSDVLKVLEEEELFLDFKNNISPCVVHPIQGEAYYYLILPVRILS